MTACNNYNPKPEIFQCSYSAKKSEGSWGFPTPFAAIVSSRAHVAAPVTGETIFQTQ